jgi:hypothetical protein
LAGGGRRLRFSTTIVNLGPGRFDVYGSNPSGPSTLTMVTQRIQENGGWVEHPTEATMFYAGDGHSHYHVYGLQDWKLAFEATPNDRIATGAKTGFCFWDNAKLWDAPKYYSGSLECRMNASGTVPMGLSAGWGDTYPWSIAFQYIDVTTLPYGNYCLTLTADPLRQFVEATTANNQVRTLISITTTGVTVLAPDCGDPSATPAMPTGLTATPGNTSVTLDWADNTDTATIYNVYRDSAPIATPTGSAYTDEGLVSGTTYCYQVTAVDDLGHESARTDPACAMPTASGGAGSSVHVADIDGSASVKGKSVRWEAFVTVTIRDQSGAPVSGATVTGQWSGAKIGPVSGATAGDGSVTFSTGKMSSGTTVILAVTNVVAGGFAYDSSANDDPDGGSDGTRITVPKQ